MQRNTFYQRIGERKAEGEIFPDVPPQKGVFV